MKQIKDLLFLSDCGVKAIINVDEEMPFVHIRLVVRQGRRIFKKILFNILVFPKKGFVYKIVSKGYFVSNTMNKLNKWHS